MALFKSGNPTLTEKMFNKSLQAEASMQGTMSVRGTINKFGFMMLMVIAGASHCIQLDQPRITAGIIQDWMTHHDA